MLKNNRIQSIALDIGLHMAWVRLEGDPMPFTCDGIQQPRDLKSYLEILLTEDGLCLDINAFLILLNVQAEAGYGFVSSFRMEEIMDTEFLNLSYLGSRYASWFQMLSELLKQGQ